MFSCTDISSKECFPAVLPWQKKDMIFDIPSEFQTQEVLPTFGHPGIFYMDLAHQNRTIAIASNFRVDGAKSPEIPQKEGVLE